jgi:hypothetical protein
MQPSTGPMRQKQLKLYMAGCKRAERRIIIGGRNAVCATIPLDQFHRQRPLIEHITVCARGGRMSRLTESLMALRVARSKFAAELEGIPWSM